MWDIVCGREKRVRAHQQILKGCATVIPSLRNMDIVLVATIFSHSRETWTLGWRIRIGPVVGSVMKY